MRVFERERTCTDTFIPALVDARVSLDVPAGIAARARREGREALIAAARSEWVEDSQDAAIAATCEQIAGAPRGAAFAVAGSKCAPHAACGDFVACVMPVLREEVLRR